MSTILPILLNAYETKNWTYRDMASGHLAGNKVGRIFSYSKIKFGLFPWISTTVDQASLYFKARDLGLFEKIPALRKPFLFGVCAIAVINLRTVMKGRDNFDRQSTQGVVSSPLWHLTPKINAIGLTAIAVCEFPQQPIKTAMFFVSGAVSFASRFCLGTVPPLWGRSLWIARAQTAWTGSWSERGLTAFKVVKSVLFKG